jgi:hypothetical protein
MPFLRAVSIVFVVASLTACGSELEIVEGDGAPPIDTEWNVELQGVYDCSESQDTGYRNGQSFQITVVHVDGEPVETDTANAYIAMQAAAAACSTSTTATAPAAATAATSPRAPATPTTRAVTPSTSTRRRPASSPG